MNKDKPLTDIKFKVKKSPIHGKGLFANQIIQSGTYIGDYEGSEATEDSTYVLWIGEEGEEIGVLGENELKYLNHNAKPNAEFDGVQLFALQEITQDKEITIHYGAEWENQ